MMMVFTVPRSKALKLQELIDVEEAFHLWDILKSKYSIVERVNIWSNFAHDPEFKLLAKKILNDLMKEIKLLEKELEKYAIQGPRPNRSKIKSSVNSEVLLDEFLAHDFFLVLQEQVEMFLKSFVTSTTNDSIRELFSKLLTRAIERQNLMEKYLKMKGWLETPPLYSFVPEEVKERVDTGEAFHLWDHLTYRYDGIEKTEIFHDYVYDGDFKVLIKVGLQRVLKKQAAMLEKELEYFGIPMPKHSPKVIAPPDNTEILKDEFMFKALYAGMHGAAIMHSQALKQSTTNDRLRGIFEDLLLEEIRLLDKFIKFGKLKGWLQVAPKYRL
jgi:spore coat protein CotF